MDINWKISVKLLRGFGTRGTAGTGTVPGSTGLRARHSGVQGSGILENQIANYMVIIHGYSSLD